MLIGIALIAAYLLLPLVVWPLWSRHRGTLFAVEVAVAAYALAVLGLLTGRIHFRGGLEVALAYLPLAASLMAAGLLVEWRLLGRPAPDPTRPGFIAGSAVYSVALAITCAGGVFYAVNLNTRPFVPDSEVVLPLPPGLVLLEDDDHGCGSSSCSRSLTVTGRDGRPPTKVLDELRTHLQDARGFRFDADGKGCRKAGWLIDQSRICLWLTITRQRTVWVSMSGEPTGA